jgi:hypothetical protein
MVRRRPRYLTASVGATVRGEGDQAVDAGVKDVQLVVPGAAGVEALLRATIMGLFGVAEDAEVA